MAEERVKPRSIYVEEAIQAALDSRWQEALAVNQALVERHGPDEETHNRMGKALTELGRLDEALEQYKATLQLNPLNLIAQKNVRKLSTMLESKETVTTAAQAIDVDLFTEEPGKSALTVLTPPAEGVSVKVVPADVVSLRRQDSQLVAETARGVVLGEVESKLARRIVPLMQTGNEYAAAVARVEAQEIEIIIREVSQSPANAGKPSFPITKAARRDDFRPYAKESLLADRGMEEDVVAGEDDESYVPDPTDGEEEDLEEMGMSTFQAEPDEAPVEETDEDDEGGRPEDEY